MRFIALDTETTGMDPRRDRIVELHLALVTFPDLAIEQEWSFRFNPGIPIPPDAIRLHGIRDQDVAGQPRLGGQAAGLQELLRRHPLIAYNGRRFDLPLLHNELVRCGQPGLPVHHLLVDPLELFREDAPHSLTGAVRYYLGEDHPAAHTAAGDVNAMLRVLRVQLQGRDPKKVLDGQVHKVTLDHAGHFYRDQEGTVRFGFGKHRGKPVVCHPDYLRWITLAGFDHHIKRLALQFLEHPEEAA
jgi:DNA polymerase-3 subunit epsilon